MRRCSCPYRTVPLLSSRKIRGFHLPEIAPSAADTGQSALSMESGYIGNDEREEGRYKNVPSCTVEVPGAEWAGEDLHPWIWERWISSGQAVGQCRARSLAWSEGR